MCHNLTIFWDTCAHHLVCHPCSFLIPFSLYHLLLISRQFSKTMSCAQELPTLVLERVFEYLLEKNLCNDSLTLRRYKIIDILTMTRICNTWRQVMLGQLFKTVNLKSAFPSHDTDSYSRWLDRFKFHPSLPAAIHLGISGRVRSVSLCCDFDDLLNGTSLNGFHGDIIAETAFLSVSTVKIILGKGATQFSNGQFPATADASPFCDAIGRAFPAANTIHFQWLGAIWEHQELPFFDQLYSGLLKGKTHIRTDIDIFDTELFSRTHSLLRLCQPLRELKLGSLEIVPATSEIIRRHADTLEHLSVINGYNSVLSSILLDGYGMPVSYPWLHTLSVEDDSPTADFIDLLPPDYVPFPTLSYVCCTVDCPGLIGFLLESSSSTLRSFILRTAPPLELLMRKGIFSKQYPVMELAEFDFHSIEALPVDTFRAILSLGRNASTVLIFSNTSVRFSDVAADIASLSPSVRQFRFPSLAATVEETLQLVKAQPFMGMLRASFTLSEAQTEAFREHASCTRQCVRGISVEDVEVPDRINEDDVKVLISNHIDVICAESDYFENLFMRFHPVSERLVILSASVSYFTRGMPPPVETYAALIYLALLCPSIRTIYSGSILGTNSLHRSDLQEYASFRIMEERLLALASGDKQ